MAEFLNTLVVPKKTTPVTPGTGELFLDGDNLKYRSNGGAPATEVVVSQSYGATNYMPAVTPGTAGNCLRSNGSSWVSVAPAFDASVITAGTLGLSRGGLGITSIASGKIIRASGTNTLAASTSTYPDTVAAGGLLLATSANVIGQLSTVATGSLLRSAGSGVAPAWTTATFPATVASGKLLRASASNVVSESAYTVPSSAGTSGYIWTSDGTNINSSALTAAQVATAVTPGSAGNVMTSNGSTWTSSASVVDNSVCCGRISGASGDAEGLGYIINATAIYFVPYKGNRIAIYSGGSWSYCTFSQITKTLSGLTANKNYDVFVYDSNADGVVDTIDLVAWTSNTSRATALATQDGVYVKSGATDRRYVGTIRTTSSTTTQDTTAQRFIWNFYNKIQKDLLVFETTDSWSYNTASWRAMNNSSSNVVEFVTGVFQTISAKAVHNASGTNYAMVGIGIDSTTSNFATLFGKHSGTGAGDRGEMTALYENSVDIGYHAVYPLEQASGGNMNFYGDGGGICQSGLLVKLWM